MTKIWHRKKPSFDSDLSDIVTEWKNKGYECVAAVDDPPAGWGLEEEWAFFRTNSIECAWTSNSGVTPVRSQIRSTSVGDIVEKSDGGLVVVDYAGWKELPTQEGSLVMQDNLESA